MKNHQLAIKDFTAAIKYDEDCSEGFFRRGRSQYYSKRYKEAIEDFKIAEKKQNIEMENDKEMEKNAGIPDGLGMCYHALGNFEEAL
jgi:tetratricopeptide (TPR) repeat protein